ncbi:MAG: serine endopeptidase [Polaromonas sp.]|uniref:serine endopeptidase n=1 Tax=Polaromonas sp. TaxID=1869339 RepID=UPI00272572FC|nr:serine endopeptidase [Polaromonas sp.]MDO9115116.1 serine endopeptidase [Polaromonas sp.]MDP1888891.1 serine endopeptidase [Polaromonas sp.]
MSKALRLSEKWFQRGLWLVAFVFAAFLIGLGSTVVGDLPQVEKALSLDDFIEQPAAMQARESLKTAERQGRQAQEALDQARLKLRVAQANSRSASETFSNWLATRRATERAEQDPELIERTRALDGLKTSERQALATMEAEQQKALDASQGATRTRERIAELERAAQDKWQSARRAQELRVFLYRLALTLPLLVAAGWLFAKKRKSTYWPFVWGFIFFALFAFFVELVPYLPSYGGYVRYIVGILITVLVGRQAIVSLNRYLEKQKLAEQLPDAQRREELSYDTALTRLSKGVCPGCERTVDLKNPEIDFCPHCGIGLFDHCPQCTARKSAFAKFCHACGADGKRAGVSPAPAQAGPASMA